MPQSFGDASYNDFKYSIYCNYTRKTTTLKNITIQDSTQIEAVSFNDSKDNQKTTLIDKSVENLVTPIETDDFKVYPNPARSYVNVDFSTIPQRETRIIILDNTGKTIVNIIVNSSSNKIDISRLPSGLYFVKSINQDSSITKKLIIDNY